MIGDFAKYSASRGLDVEDAIKAAAEEIGDTDFTEELRKALEELRKQNSVPELDDRFPYRLQVGNNFYYPREGTLRLLPMGHWVFVDDIYSNDDETVYATVVTHEIQGILWREKTTDLPLMAELPLAA